MIRHRTSPVLLALLLLVTAAACDRPDPISPSPADQPQELIGSLLGGGSASYTLVKDPLLPGLTNLSVSSLIGVNGGSLSLLGHTLTVPAGAVSGPTLFTLVVLPTGYVEVDLTATVTRLLGVVVDVGGNGFAKPVPVTLTYSRATNVTNPSRLTVVHLPGLLGYSKIEPIPSRVNTTAKTVTAELKHFSRYALAVP